MMGEISQEDMAFVEAQLAPLAAEGGRATYMGVPVSALSREALLGLVAHVGREQIQQQGRAEQERAMWRDIARAGRQR